MYLKVDYDVKLLDQTSRGTALHLAEALAELIASWAAGYGAEATGIVEPLEESDDEDGDD